MRNCVNAPKIIVENSVKKIGKGAFYNCTALSQFLRQVLWRSEMKLFTDVEV